MVIITREQAIRISYHKTYDKSKASESLKAIENINVELCYKNDPWKTILLYMNSTYADPYNILTYQKANEYSGINNEIQDKKK